MGVGFKALQHRLGVCCHLRGSLQQGSTLGFEAIHQAADTFFVGAKGTLNGGHFFVDDVFKCCGALQCVFNTTDQHINFLAHTLGNRGQAFSGNVLWVDQAHGLLHQNFGGVAQLL